MIDIAAMIFYDVTLIEEIWYCIPIATVVDSETSMFILIRQLAVVDSYSCPGAYRSEHNEIIIPSISNPAQSCWLALLKYCAAFGFSLLNPPAPADPLVLYYMS